MVSVKQITDVISSLYKDEYEGLLVDFHVVTPEDGMDSIGSLNPLVICLLINDEVYRSTMNGDKYGGGYYTIMDMEKKIKSIVKYIGIGHVEFARYMDNEEKDLKFYYGMKEYH